MGVWPASEGGRQKGGLRWWCSPTPDILAAAAFSATGRTLAFALDGSQTGTEPDRDFYVACNARSEPVSFRIPRSPSGKTWRRIVDTALKSPQDIVAEGEGPRVAATSAYRVAPFGMAVLISEE